VYRRHGDRKQSTGMQLGLSIMTPASVTAVTRGKQIPAGDGSIGERRPEAHHTVERSLPIPPGSAGRHRTGSLKGGDPRRPRWPACTMGATRPGTCVWNTPPGLRETWEADALRELEESRAAGDKSQGMEHAWIIATGGRRAIRRMHTIAFGGHCLTCHREHETLHGDGRSFSGRTAQNSGQGSVSGRPGRGMKYPLRAGSRPAPPGQSLHALTRRREYIAYAPYSPNVARRSRLLLDLAPQASDAHIHTTVKR
jgi:hypothetical protein